jgi:hypothetical protein
MRQLRGNPSKVLGSLRSFINLTPKRVMHLSLRENAQSVMHGGRTVRFFSERPSRLTKEIESLNKINSRSLMLHEKLSLQLKLSFNHVIVYHNGELSLFEKDEDNAFNETSKETTPALGHEYILYKTLSHLVVELNMILISLNLEVNDFEETQSHLQTLKNDIEKAQGIVAKSGKVGISLPDVLTPSQKVLGKLTSLIGTTSFEQLQTVLSELLRSYNKSVTENLDRFGELATESQLKGIDGIVKSWRDEFLLDSSQARVLIVGAKGPRKGMIEMQYFERFLKDKTDALTYVETPVSLLPKVEVHGLIAELLKTEFNSKIAGHILGRTDGMNQDVLAKHAAPVIEELGVEEEEKAACPFHK